MQIAEKAERFCGKFGGNAKKAKRHRFCVDKTVFPHYDEITAAPQKQNTANIGLDVWPKCFYHDAVEVVTIGF